MNKEEKKAIEITKTLIEFAEDAYIPKRNREKLQILLNLIDKLNKVIDEMAKYMEDRRECGQAEEFCDKEDCYADEYINGHCPKCLNCIKEYFIRKANGDEK